MQQTYDDQKIGVNPNDIIDLGRYFNLVKRNWFKIFIFAVFVTIISILVALSLTSKYTATATLLIEAHEKQAVSIQDVVGIDTTQKEYYQTQFEILKSNQIANYVIDKLQLDTLEEFNPSLKTEKGFFSQLKDIIAVRIKSIPFVENILKKDNKAENEISADDLKYRQHQIILNIFKGKLEIKPIKGTQLVQIRFTSEDPKLAAKIANAVGYAYIETNLESRLSETKYATSWISGRLGELRDQLTKSEDALSEFLTKEKLIDDSGIDALASQELGNLTKRLSTVRDQRIQLESAYNALISGRANDIASLSSIPELSKHPQVINIRSAQIDAENEVRELSKRYGPRHDKMIAAKAKLESINNQAQKLISKLIGGMRKELAATRQEETLLSAELQKSKGDYQQLTVKKSKYQSLKREVETNRNILNVFLTREKENTATSDFNSTNAHFTDEALVPQMASKPKRKVIVAAAFFLSLCFGAMFVVVIDLFKQTIESVGDFEERFGIIALSGIPAIRMSRFRRKPLDSSVLFDEKQIDFGESIRSIRTSLLLSNNNKSVAITSSLPSEGKTTMAINIAMSFAKLEKTILIDCDLRKSSLIERFGYKKYQQGLSNYLMLNTELGDCIITDERSGLDILPAGMVSPNPQELLSSDKFEQLLAHLVTIYDRIIIDTPPSLPVSDSLIISQLTDSTLVVVKANETKQDNVEKTIAKLVHHKVNIGGFIVNAVNRKLSSDEYGYGVYQSKYNGKNS